MLCPACWIPAWVPAVPTARTYDWFSTARARASSVQWARRLLGPARGDDQRLGARIDQAAEHFREAQVVAGGKAQGGLRQSDRDQVLARSHHDRLALVEAEAVDLAVCGGPLALGGEDECGVVEGAVVGALDEGARVQPDPGVGGGLRHDLVGGPLKRLGLVLEVGVREGADRPEFGKDHQIRTVLGRDQRSRAPPAGIDGFVRVYCDLDEGGVHTTTVLAFEPSTQAYDRHTKALPGCLLAA